MSYNPDTANSQIAFHAGNRTQIMDPQNRVFNAYWVSRTLNVPGRKCRLTKVNVGYMANSDCVIYLYGTRDGGKTWSNLVVGYLEDTDGGIGEVGFGFNLTGPDVRVKVELTMASDDAVILSITARVVDTSEIT